MSADQESFASEEMPASPQKSSWTVRLTVTPPPGIADILPEDTPEEIRQARQMSTWHQWTKLPTLQELEWQYLQMVLLMHSGNKSTTAEALGIDRRTVYRRLRKGLGTKPSEKA